MLVHPSLSHEVLDRWSISTDIKVAAFKSEQLGFLEHHRKFFAVKAGP
jgi:hypothetical protein